MSCGSQESIPVASTLSDWRQVNCLRHRKCRLRSNGSHVDTSKCQLDFGAGGISMVRKFDRELKLEAIRMPLEEGCTAVEV